MPGRGLRQRRLCRPHSGVGRWQAPALSRLLPAQELSPFKNCVVATGGGVPTKAENWGHMQGGVSVWLNGPPTLLAHRVVGDGTESRPLLSQVRPLAPGLGRHVAMGGGWIPAAPAHLSACMKGWW